MFHKFHKGIRLEKTPLAFLVIGQIEELAKPINAPIVQKNKKAEIFAGIQVENLSSDSS